VFGPSYRAGQPREMGHGALVVIFWGCRC